MNKQITLSTNLSNNKNPNNPSYYINPTIYSIDSFVVTTFSGINNFYTIDSRNCNIRIQELQGFPRDIVIPSGNYTVSTMLTTLGTLLSIGSNLGTTYTATKSDLTNLITITRSSSTFTLEDTVNSCYYELGFVVRKKGFSGLDTSQTGSQQYDLSGVKTIHVISNDFGNDGSVVVNSNYNILCSIPITVPYLGVINYERNSDLLINCKVSELSSITFTLLDERMRILGNLSDWSIQLITNFN